jgi:hypothetical protein
VTAERDKTVADVLSLEEIRQLLETDDYKGFERCCDMCLLDFAQTVALLSERQQLTGEDWNPTTSIDRTFEAMEARGLGAWVESVKAFMGSAGAYYTMEAYRAALGDVEVAKQRAMAAEAERQQLQTERDAWREEEFNWRGEALALRRRAARYEEALRWFASEEAWEVTPSSVGDGRYRFDAPPDSVYATPWGFARAALVSGEAEKDPPQ